MKQLLPPLLCLFLAVNAAAEDNLAVAQKMVSDTMARVDKIDTESLKAMIDQEQEFVLLDVRTPTEINNMGKIDAPQQLEIPRGWLEMRIFQHVDDKEVPIVVYCGGGIRSAFAVETLQQMGFTNARNYEAGFLDWENKGYPVKY
ncbi:MAG: rhodanese-like domain-containing protein [Pseudomonadota bacterium]|nr:rhodanese-like domain-containing protein [Pseudomonadota bacterium]